MKENIEKKVSDTILSKSLQVQIGNKTYNVAPPTIATIILASEAISRLPKVNLDSAKVVQECFGVAKNCRALGEIAAILILGGKRAKQNGYLYRMLHRKSEKEKLTEEILNNYSPNALFNLVTKIFATMELRDFFGLTTFLTEINLLHPTKVVN